MGNFKPDPKGMKDLEKHLQKLFDDVITKVGKSHRGQSRASIEGAVRREVANSGVTFDVKAIRQIADTIQAIDGIGR